jgi:hypothetical protein
MFSASPLSFLEQFLLCLEFQKLFKVSIKQCGAHLFSLRFLKPIPFLLLRVSCPVYARGIELDQIPG